LYSYIARRLAFGALTVVGVSIMVFVVMRILPGDPLVAIFGPEGMTKLTEEQRASYMAELLASARSNPSWGRSWSAIRLTRARRAGASRSGCDESSRMMVSTGISDPSSKGSSRRGCEGAAISRRDSR
jgi:hypothetical protein